MKYRIDVIDQEGSSEIEAATFKVEDRVCLFYAKYGNLLHTAPADKVIITQIK